MKNKEREFRSSSTCFGAVDTEPLLRGAKSISLLIAILPVILICLSIGNLRSKRNRRNSKKNT